MRASTTGSLGTANGRRSMITQLNCSPCTSTPCQKDEVPKRTAFGVSRNCWSSTLRGGRAVQEQRVRKLSEQTLVRVAHLGVAGEEAEGAAFGDLEDAADALDSFLGEVRLAWVGHVRRKVEESLFFVVEVRWHDQLARGGEAETVANVIEATRDGERGRGEDDRVVVVKERGGKKLGDVDRSRLQGACERPRGTHHGQDCGRLRQFCAQSRRRCCDQAIQEERPDERGCRRCACAGRGPLRRSSDVRVRPQDEVSALRTPV